MISIGYKGNEILLGYYEDYLKNIRNEKDKRINLPKKVLFNGMKTTVLFKSNKENQKYDSTSVTCQEGDIYDKQKGLLLAYFIHNSGLSKTEALNYLERKCK